MCVRTPCIDTYMVTRARQIKREIDRENERVTHTHPRDIFVRSLRYVHPVLLAVVNCESISKAVVDCEFLIKSVRFLRCTFPIPSIITYYLRDLPIIILRQRRDTPIHANSIRHKNS